MLARITFFNKNSWLGFSDFPCVFQGYVVENKAIIVSTYSMPVSVNNRVVVTLVLIAFLRSIITRRRASRPSEDGLEASVNM